MDLEVGSAEGERLEIDAAGKLGGVSGMGVGGLEGGLEGEGILEGRGGRACGKSLIRAVSSALNKTLPLPHPYLHPERVL